MDLVINKNREYSRSSGDSLSIHHNLEHMVQNVIIISNFVDFLYVVLIFLIVTPGSTMYNKLVVLFLAMFKN